MTGDAARNLDEVMACAPVEATDVIVRSGATAIAREQFFEEAYALAADLPDGQYAVNLCEDRYRFAVAFAAVLLKGQTNLLAPSRVPAVCDEIAGRYPRSYCLVESRHAGLGSPQHVIEPGSTANPGARRFPLIDTRALAPPEHIAAIAFTSGSTGTPQANPKPWGTLVLGAHLAYRQFGFETLTGYTMVATVPPQHMYGLETSIMIPLVCGGSLVTGSVLFPEDIRRTLNQAPAPRMLVTTPAHLRAMMESGLEWPTVAIAISATAPLDPALARRAERAMNTEVHEIFGFSEAGSVASRRTTDGPWWRLYSGLELAAAEGEVQVGGGHVPHPVPFNDRVQVAADSRFKLLGRKSDVVNVAGKRTSLTELNAKLTRIDGVVDGVFVPPHEGARSDRSTAELARLGAIVVAPGLTKRQVLDALAQALDPVFMPRPLRKVAALPRNETGKLPRSELIALLEREDDEATADSESPP